jgi:hypothetical protein
MRRDARRRHIPFSLTIQDIETHWQARCTYCGVKTTTANLDRVDSTRGYEPKNVVPCCPTCNGMKGSLDLKVFIRQVQKISARQKR